MTDIPGISVIIPVYNSEKWLKECLDSVLGQTFENFEVIAVNDGSTDSSRKILEEYSAKDDRVRIVDRKNGGLSAARNTGIDASQGKYLFFLDSDDIISVEALRYLYEALEVERADVSAGIITYDRKSLHDIRKEVRCISVAGAAFCADILYQTGEYILSACCRLYKRNLFEGERRFAEGQYYEDLELIPRIVAGTGKIALVPLCLYFYRQHPASFVHTFNPSRFDSLKSVASLERHVAPVSEELAKAVSDRKLSANFNAYILAEKHAGYEEMADACWRNISNLRFQSLVNPKVRIKNKAGILLSYLGRRVFKAVARFLQE